MAVETVTYAWIGQSESDRLEEANVAALRAGRVLTNPSNSNPSPSLRTAGRGRRGSVQSRRGGERGRRPAEDV